MASITAFIQSDRNPAGVYIRLTDGRKIDCKAKTKFNINPKDWSDSKGRPTNLKDADLAKLNEDIEALKSDLLAHYNKRSDTDRIDTNWLKQFLNPDEKISTELVGYFEYFLKLKKSEFTNDRTLRLTSHLNTLKEFQATSKKVFRILDFDLIFKSKYTAFMKGMKYADNSISLYLSTIKMVVIHAKDNLIPVSHQLDKIEITFTDSPFVFLDDKEQAAIEKIKLHWTLEDARWWLLISCQTGQRYSDFIRFKDTMIRYQVMKIGEKDVRVPLLEFKQDKTNANISLPLNDKMMRYLAVNGGKFPKTICYDFYIKKIKEICRLASIDEITFGSISEDLEEGQKLHGGRPKRVEGYYEKYKLVGSHIGRRSFATNNYGKWPTPLLMSVTGHTTERSFLRYIGKTDSTKALHLAHYMYGG